MNLYDDNLWEVWYDEGPGTPAFPCYSGYTRMTFLDRLDAKRFAGILSDSQAFDPPRRFAVKRKVS